MSRTRMIMVILRRYGSDYPIYAKGIPMDYPDAFREARAYAARCFERFGEEELERLRAEDLGGFLARRRILRSHRATYRNALKEINNMPLNKAWAMNNGDIEIGLSVVVLK